MAEVDRLGALQVGVAGHRPVAVGLGEAAAAAPSPRAQRRIARREAALTTIAMSVATWSLRERPVWSLPARAPISSPSSRSIAMWMSSSDSSKAKPGASIRARTRSRPAAISSASASVSTPTRASAAGVRLRLEDVVGRQLPVEGQRAVHPPEARVGLFAEPRRSVAVGPLVAWEAGHQRPIIPAARTLRRRRRPPARCRRARSAPRSSAGKNGSASECAEAASATGNWPSR